MEINTRALTSHSKHNGSRMKYYAYNLTIPNYRISSNNSRGQEPQWLLSGAIISFFAHKGGDYSREGDYLREAIISNVAYWKSSPKYFVYYAIKSKNNHIK